MSVFSVFYVSVTTVLNHSVRHLELTIRTCAMKIPFDWLIDWNRKKNFITVDFPRVLAVPPEGFHREVRAWGSPGGGQQHGSMLPAARDSRQVRTDGCHVCWAGAGPRRSRHLQLRGLRHQSGRGEVYQDIYLPVTLKCTQEFVLVSSFVQCINKETKCCSWSCITAMCILCQVSGYSVPDRWDFVSGVWLQHAWQVRFCVRCLVTVCLTEARFCYVCLVSGASLTVVRFCQVSIFTVRLTIFTVCLT